MPLRPDDVTLDLDEQAGTGFGPAAGPFPAQIQGVPVPLNWLTGPSGRGGIGDLTRGYAGAGQLVTTSNALRPGVMPPPPVPVLDPKPAFGFVQDTGRVWSGVVGFVIGALATAVGFLAAARRR